MLRISLPYGALAILGAMVGIVGTGGHRFFPYVGSALVIGLVLAAGVFARAWKSWTGLMVFAMTWISSVLMLIYLRGPGESIAILEDTLGEIWLYGGSIAIIAPAFIPQRLVTEGSYAER